MGQANSMYTVTERGDYYCGDVVRGAINLNCVQPFQCTGVHLTVSLERNSAVLTASFL
jgi:hypothetical protein